MIPGITWGADFAGIVRYLTENRDHEVLDLHGITAMDLAADEMSAVASLNWRAKNQLLHLSLSAAHEDGSLEAHEWMRCIDSVTSALCLDGHMRVVVRHSDKTHDHVHAFVCTISPVTCQTPSKRWFLKKGSGVNDIGPHALTDEQVVTTSPDRRARRTYDFRALARAMNVCRRLERELNLRQLKSPLEAGRERDKGATKGATPGQRKRAERTGSIPLADRADEIRHALNTRDWPSKERALQAIGLTIELVQRETKNGVETRGVVFADIADPGNRIRASDLDLPSAKYGLRCMEERHEPGAERIEQWWPKRVVTHPATAKNLQTGIFEPRLEFDRLRLEHKLAEREKSDRRKRLRCEHASIRASKSCSLMRMRKEAALKLAPSQRRAFYRTFSIEVAGPVKAKLIADQTQELRTLARTRMATWSEFVAARTPVSMLPKPSTVVRKRIVETTGSGLSQELDQAQVQRKEVSTGTTIEHGSYKAKAADRSCDDVAMRRRIQNVQAQRQTERELFLQRSAAFEEAKRRAQDEEWAIGPERGRF